MKYEVKGLTSYGVYDGDRLCGTYESEKEATLVAEALNEEAGRSTEAAHRALGQSGTMAQAIGASGLNNPYDQTAFTNGHAPQETD